MIYNVNGNILYNNKYAEFSDNMTIDYEYDSVSNANYIILRIFQTKKDGTKQFPFVRAPGRTSTTALAQAEDWQLIINAGLGVSASQPYDGVVIENGSVIYGDPCTYHVNAQPLTIDADGNLSYAASDAIGAQLIANNDNSEATNDQKIISACCGFCPIIVDFEKTNSFPAVDINGEGNHFNTNAQRQIIGQFGNGDYAILSCEGRNYDNSDGWTLAEAQDICIKHGLKFAYCLDGGGSVSTIVNQKLLTPNYLLYRNPPRLLPTFIVFNGTTNFSIPDVPVGNYDETEDVGVIASELSRLNSTKANINSPALTGTPTAPTAIPGTNSNQIATTAFVTNAIQGSIVVQITPAVEGILATASLNGSSYSVQAYSNELGQITIPLNYYGNYTLSYSSPRVKSDRYISVFSNVAVQVPARYSELVVYTVRIDETNSNPNTACVYMDDAEEMVKGSASWDEMPIFNDIAPCVFQDGAVNYYLNPNNFAQKRDGTNAVLTGADGDVMIEFKRFAYRIYRDGNYLYVSITNNDAIAQADNRYTYDAFSRITEGDLDKFYIGAFKGYVDPNNSDGKLRSIAGVQPTSNKNMSEFRTAAQANGSHYQQSTYSHLKAIQCLYLIKYGNRNGQETLGKGIVNVTDDSTSNLSYLTGYNIAADDGVAASALNSEVSTFTSGMNYGTTSDGLHHMKLFGIEDFWGNIYEWVDGLTTDASWNIITSWNNFTGEDVTATTNSYASGLTADGSGWNKVVAGTTAAGFMPVEWGGSSSTYWADSGYLFASNMLSFSGYWSSDDYTGPFFLVAYNAAYYRYRYVGARLSYN